MTVHVTHYLSFPWEFVTSLFWRRYPNPHAKHVLSEDVLERYLLSDGRLYTKRLLIKKISKRIPFWLLRFFPKGQVSVVEESIIDVNGQRVDVVSKNFGAYKKYLLVGEYCSLVPSDDHSVTKISRILSLESSLKGILRSAVMKTSQTYYNSSYKDTYLGYMYLCNTYSNAYNPKERQSPTNDVPKSSVRTVSTNETQEYTSSKLPRIVMADSG